MGATADPGGHAVGDPDDAVLVGRLAHGDEAAFRALYDRHADAVYNAAYRMLGDAAGAADATQDVFLALLEKHGTVADPSRVGGWLVRGAVHRAIDRWRRRRLEPSSLDAAGAMAAGPASPGDQPVFRLVAREEEARVAGAILALPLGLREAIVLRYVEGASYEHIAEILGIEVGTVKSRLHRAHAALRDMLA